MLLPRALKPVMADSELIDGRYADSTFTTTVASGSANNTTDTMQRIEIMCFLMISIVSS
jgi:hypothetical protein